MSTIGKLWAGQIFGTNTGNLFVEFSSDDDNQLEGVVRFMDARFGLVLYAVEGTFDGSKIEFRGEPTQSPEGIAVAAIQAKGALTPEGTLRGSWTSDLGTGGTFVLHPHDLPSEPLPGLPPEQIQTALRTLGALRLYGDDVQELISFVARDFRQGRVIVTYLDRGNEVIRYATDFMAETSKPAELRYLKLTIQEPEAYGVNRLVSVELNANGANEVRAQGVHEAWVTGKAETIAAFLRQHQKALSTRFRRTGLNFNLILFFGIALVLLPELTLWRRAIFVAVIILTAFGVQQLHARFIPNLLIYLSPRKANAFERAWPQVLSWLIAATSGLVAAIAYGILKGDLDWWSWMSFGATSP